MPDEQQPTVSIDDAGRIKVETGAAVRRLSSRAGRYRIVPSSAKLLILERIDSAELPAGNVVVSGDIAQTGGLIDVIHFINSNAWSGQLAVLSGQTRKSIYFKGGDVSTAASNVVEDRIGAILYRFGMITAAELEHALAQVTQEHRFGQILVEKGTLTTHDLYQYVRKQIEEIFHSVIGLKSGEYYFYRTTEEAGPPSQLQLPTKGLLFEGVRRLDEMSYFRQKIPSSEAVLVKKLPPPAAKLQPLEQRVLNLVDGERDVATIARQSHLGEFDATRVLFQLLHSGHVAVRAARPPAEVSPPAPQVAFLQMIDAFNDAYAKVHDTIRDMGKLPSMQRWLDSFFQSMTQFAPLFVAVHMLADGRLPREQVLSNLEMAPVDNKLDYLHRGLSELLSFELFSAGEAADQSAVPEMHQRLHDILRSMPPPPREPDVA